jgi:hypothetical protein
MNELQLIRDEIKKLPKDILIEASKNRVTGHIHLFVDIGNQRCLAPEELKFNLGSDILPKFVKNVVIDLLEGIAEFANDGIAKIKDQNDE